jgi:hypothetical protein
MPHIPTTPKPMSTSQTYGLKMPFGFDVKTYDGVAKKAVLISNPNDATSPGKINSWFGFSDAWIGLGMRLRSVVEYDDEFGRLIASSTSPGREEQFH